MSTRCQVKVIQEGMPWEAERTLYHHCDGYPEHMLPAFRAAWDEAREYLNNEHVYSRRGDYWELGRAAKAASFLCRHEPGQFEPEEGHALHCDIEYYYRLWVINDLSTGAVSWEVEMFEPCDRRGPKFWDAPAMEGMKCTLERTEVGKAALLPLAQRTPHASPNPTPA